MLDASAILKLYAFWRMRRLSRLSATHAQRQILQKLVRQAERTSFGTAHGFSGVHDVKDFQSATPIRGYDAFWREFWQASFPMLNDCTWPGLVPFFALSSGTTMGTTKYIPHTPQMSQIAMHGMRELLAYHSFNRPDTRLLGGKGLMLTGPLDLEQLAPGVRAGAISAISAERTPRWLKHRLLPPQDIASMHDWQAKIARLAPLSLQEDVRGLGGSPNWLLLFLDEVFQHRSSSDGRLVDLYPNLELIVHGGVNFAPYRPAFEDLLRDSHAETREVYSASEGFFAVADRGDGEGLRLLVDAGIFFEFVPAEELHSATPRRHWIGDIETGIEYAMLATTPAGLWAYSVGDTVRFVSRDPPRLVVTGRTSYVLSAFGEHLIEEEIAQAVTSAAVANGTHVLDYTVAAVMPESDETGGWHEYIVECAPEITGTDAVGRFGQALDAKLCALNDDYRELRHRDYSVKPPRVTFAPSGGFVAWMKLRRGLGGQNKVPRIIRDAKLFADIRQFMERLKLDNGPS